MSKQIRRTGWWLHDLGVVAIALFFPLATLMVLTGY